MAAGERLVVHSFATCCPYGETCMTWRQSLADWTFRSVLHEAPSVCGVLLVRTSPVGTTKSGFVLDGSVAVCCRFGVAQIGPFTLVGWLPTLIKSKNLTPFIEMYTKPLMGRR